MSSSLPVQRPKDTRTTQISNSITFILALSDDCSFQQIML